MLLEKTELKNLISRHKYLDALIRKRFDEYADDSEITSLKLERLRVKRKIKALEHDGGLLI